MVKEELSKEEALQCKQVIFSLLQLEAKHETLPVPSLGGGRGGKGGFRREEQYRLLWSELEIFLKSHANQSTNHNEVLNCLLEIRNKDDKDNKVELDQALRELDGYYFTTFNSCINIIRTVANSVLCELALSKAKFLF